MSKRSSSTAKDHTAPKRTSSMNKARQKVEPKITWENSFDAIEINDADWTCSVALLVESKESESVLIEQLNEAIDSGQRRVLKKISYKELLQMVQGPRISQVPKPADISTHAQILREEALKCLGPNSEGKLPAKLLARLLKLRIMALKEETKEMDREQWIDLDKLDFNRQNFDKRKSGQFKDQEQLVSKTSLSVSQAVNDGKNVNDTHELKKRRKEGIDPHESNHLRQVDTCKSPTKLKKRGEEWKSTVHIDDAPKDGAQLYIVITGFYDPDLPLEMVLKNIPLFCFVKITVEEDILNGYNTCTASTLSYLNHQMEDRDNRTVLKTTINTEIEGQATEVREQVSQKISKFWEEFNLTMKNLAHIQLFKNVAFMLLNPPIVPNHHENSKHKIISQKLMYDEIAYLMYDLQDVIRQHKHYLKSMKVMQIETPPPIDMSNMYLYNCLVNKVPPECVTVSYVLHCMLEQVSKAGISTKTVEVIEPQISLNRSPSIEKKEKIALKLKDALEKHNKMHSALEPIKKQTEACEYLSVLQKDGDFMRTFHFNDRQCREDLAKIHQKMLMGLPFMREWTGSISDGKNPNDKVPFPCNSLFIQLFNRVRCLKSDMSNISKPDDFLFRRRSTNYSEIRESSILSALKTYSLLSSPSHLITSENLSSCLDSQGVIWKFLEPTTNQTDVCKSLGVKKESSSSYNCNFVDSYASLDRLSKNVILQVLESAYMTFNCVDVLHHKSTDVLLLHFHDYHDNDGLFTNTYTIYLPSPVGLRDFNNIVIKQESEWIEKEESIYQDQIEKTVQAQETEVHKTASPDKYTTKEIQEQVKSEIVFNTPIYYSMHSDIDFLIGKSIKHTKYKKTLKEKTIHCVEEVKSILKTIENLKVIKNKEVTPRTKGPKPPAKSSHRKKSVSLAVKEDLDSNKYPGGKVENNTLQKIKNEKEGQSLPVKGNQNIDGHQYSLEGYNIDCNHVHYSGKTNSFFPLGGSQVRLETGEWTYGYHNLSLYLTALENTLCFHSVQKCISSHAEPLNFHLSLACGAIVVFSRNSLPTSSDNTHSTSIVLPPDQSAKENKLQQKKSWRLVKLRFKTDTSTSSKSLKGKKVNTQESSSRSSDTEGSDFKPFQRYKLYDKYKELFLPFAYNLLVSWPCGLRIETVKTDHVPMYIKQCRHNKGPECATIKEEVHRCFLPNGNILKFMRNHSVINLCPDGTIFTCLSFKKQGATVEDSTITLGETEEEDKEEISNTKNSTGSRKKVTHHTEKDSKGNLLEETRDESEDFKREEETFLWDVTVLQVVAPDGRQFLVREDGSVDDMDPILVRTTTDLETGEVFTRRSDGTKTILRPNGTLIVSFPDDSRITSYVTEECGQNFISRQPHIFSYLISPSTLDEDFIMVNMDVCMEHPNYAKVKTHGGGFNMEIGMTDGITMKVFEDGTYSIDIRGEINLEVKDQRVVFTHIDKKSQSNLSKSVLDLTSLQGQPTSVTNSPPIVLCSTTDSDGNVFQVNSDGSTAFKPRTKPKESTKREIIPSERRCFVVKRDLTASELLPRVETMSHLDHVSRQMGAFLFVEPTSEDPSLNHLVTLCPLKRGMCSGHYEMPTDILTHRRHRNKIVRSTYGDPSQWFHPLPKRKCPEDKELSWVKRNNRTVAYSVKIFKDILPSDTSSYASCFDKAVRVPKLGDLVVTDQSGGVSKCFILQPRIMEDTIESFLNGEIPSIVDFFLDVAKRENHKIPRGVTTRYVSEKVDTSVLASHAHQHCKDVLYYRDTKRGVLEPYFSSIQGEMFLAVLGCVHRAVDKVKGSMPDASYPKEGPKSCSCRVTAPVTLGESQSAAVNAVLSTKYLVQASVRAQSMWECNKPTLVSDQHPVFTREERTCVKKEADNRTLRKTRDNINKYNPETSRRISKNNRPRVLKPVSNGKLVGNDIPYAKIPEHILRRRPRKVVPNNNNLEDNIHPSVIPEGNYFSKNTSKRVCAFEFKKLDMDFSTNFEEETKNQESNIKRDTNVFKVQPYITRI